jgi:hypothetical protein
MTNITSGFKATGLYLLKAIRETAFASFMLTQASAPFIPDAVDKENLQPSDSPRPTTSLAPYNRPRAEVSSASTLAERIVQTPI